MEDSQESLIAAVPYKIHTVLTDNGIQFTLGFARLRLPASLCRRPDSHMDDPHVRHALQRKRDRTQAHQNQAPMDQRPGRTDEPDNQGSNRQAIPLRQPRAADSPPPRLHRCLQLWGRLKTLKGLTPFEYICKIWKTEPDRFTLNPNHQMTGLNNYPHKTQLPVRILAAFIVLDSKQAIVIGPTPPGTGVIAPA
jgi:hypothetical protein